MKRILNYIIVLIVLVIFVAGCSKQTAVPNIVIPSPQGNFIGKFTLIHKSSKTGLQDTSSAIVTIVFPGNGIYSVGGDTTKIQAASYGTFFVDGTFITFSDATVTKLTSPNAPKKHLQGPFLYDYNGTNLNIFGASDTPSFNYALAAY